MITIENEAELLAEHNAAKTAVKEAEDAKWRAEQATRDAARRATYAAQITPHLEQIAKHIPATAYEPTIREGRLFIKDRDTCFDFDFKEHFAKTSSWRSIRTGKWKFVVGRYGDRSTFPELAKGGFNYAKIADKLVDCYNRRAAQDQSEHNRRTNEQVVAALKQKLNLRSYDWSLQPSQRADKPVHFKVTMDRTLTADEAEALVKALTPYGVFSFNND